MRLFEYRNEFHESEIKQSRYYGGIFRTYICTEAYECTEMLHSMAISQLSIFRVVKLDHDFSIYLCVELASK